MSGFIKPAGWGGSYRDDFADKLGILGLGYCLDEEREYDIYVGEGGQESAFFHHYIVIDSPDLPDNNRRIVFELAKGFEANPSGALVPGVRLYSSGGLKYRITVKTTLRTLAELASGILHKMGSYNLITSSCQNFCDEFLKQLGSSGYWTYVKVGVAAAVVGGLIGYGAKLLYDAVKEEQNKKDKK